MAAKRFGSLLFLLGLPLFVSGCESSAVDSFRITGMNIVSVVPAHMDADGNVFRQCSYREDRPVNAVQVSFALSGIANFRRDAVNDGAFLDGVFPGDFVSVADGTIVEVAAPGEIEPESAEKRAILPEDIFLKPMCLSPHPAARFTSDCLHPMNQVLRADRLDFLSNSADGTLRDPDRSLRSVAILVDQSGSMNGFVEPLTGFEYEPNLKRFDGVPSWISSDGFAARGSDYPAFRATMVQRLFGLLDPNDPAGVFIFGEDVAFDGARILTDQDYWNEELARAENFGVNRQLLLNSPAISQLQSSAKGRAPLWAAVQDVYSYLKHSQDTPVKHLLVITDGPDTCARSSADFAPVIRYFRTSTRKFETGIQDECSGIGLDDFLELVIADTTDKNGDPLPSDQIPVHVSFIQMSSMGYRDVDPGQQQVACLTGGHYFWIDSATLPPSNVYDQDVLARWNGSHPLQAYLGDAVERFAASLSGAWAGTFRLPDLESQYTRELRDLDDPGVQRAAERSESIPCEDPEVDWSKVFGGTHVSLHARLGPAFSDLARTLLNPDLVQSDTVGIDNGIDRRAVFYLPAGDGAPNCYEYMPLCSIAAQMSHAMKDSSQNPMAEIVKSVECMNSVAVGDLPVCRVFDEYEFQSCSQGLCCQGQCLSKPDDENIWELDENCNWTTKAPD